MQSSRMESQNRRALKGFTIVSRLLWPGVGRMAIEESRRLPAALVVLRQSKTPLSYDLSDLHLDYLRLREESGFLSPLFLGFTMLYQRHRGPDATVDLDLILAASRTVRGPALFHDQFAGIAGYLRHRRTGQDYWVYLHETTLAGRISKPLVPFRALDRAVLRSARCVFTNSVKNQSALAEEGIRSIVAYPGCIPLQKIQPARERFVLAVSVWDSGRRPDVYARLSELLHCKLVMAGTWARPEDLARFREKNSEKLWVTGPIDEQTLSSLSSRASAYIRFGFNERGPGQGGIQAMGYGLPVVSNKDLGMSELIEDGVNGYVVESVEEAADRINHLLDNQDLLNSMMLCAWERSKTLTWDDHVDRLRDGM